MNTSDIECGARTKRVNRARAHTPVHWCECKRDKAIRSAWPVKRDETSAIEQNRKIIERSNRIEKKTKQKKNTQNLFNPET